MYIYINLNSRDLTFSCCGDELYLCVCVYVQCTRVYTGAIIQAVLA